jgi:hypothetical protein
MKGSDCRSAAPMRNVDSIVIAPTVAYVLLVAFALWAAGRHWPGTATRVVHAWTTGRT